MSLFERIAGVLSSFFQIGGPGGPGWNDNAGALEAKNSTNSAFAVIRGADPVASNDLVTLEYLNTAGPVSLPIPNFQLHKVLIFNGNVSSGSVPTNDNHSGFATFSASGSTSAGTAPNALASTNVLTATARYRAFTTSTTGQIGIREGSALTAWRGNAAGIGGFYFRARFAITGVAVTNTMNAFIGLYDGVSVATALDFVTDVTDKVGIGFTASAAGSAIPATDWLILEANGTTITTHDPGASFAVTLNHLMELIFYCAPNDTKISYVLNDLSSGATTSGTLNTTLPRNTIFMAPWCQLNIAASGTGNNIWDVSLMYLEIYQG